MTEYKLGAEIKCRRPAFWFGIAVVGCLIIVSAVFGISKQNESSSHTIDEVPSIKSYAIYKMRTSEKGTSKKNGRYDPNITIYSDRTFDFSYNPMSSYSPHGTYKVENNVLTAVTDDRKYTYVFETVDENVIKFVQNGSSDISAIDERYAIPIEDGAEFELFLSQPINCDEPQISITAPDKKVNYKSVIHKWDGTVYKYSKQDTLEGVMLSSAGGGPVHVSEGEMIEIEFPETVPESYELTAEIMDESGKRVPKESRKTIPITFQNGKGSFIFSKSDMYGWADEKRVGFRLLCQWGKNECEYGFLVYIKE